MWWIVTARWPTTTAVAVVPISVISVAVIVAVPLAPRSGSQDGFAVLLARESVFWGDSGPEGGVEPADRSSLTDLSAKQVNHTVLTRVAACSSDACGNFSVRSKAAFQCRASRRILPIRDASRTQSGLRAQTSPNTTPAATGPCASASPRPCRSIRCASTLRSAAGSRAGGVSV